MTEVVLLAGARIDFREAADWYRAKGGSVAQWFQAAVARTLGRIAENPAIFGWHDHTVREATVKRFPYRLLYRVESSARVIVVAVAHTSRDPDYWRSRVPDPGGDAP